MPPLIVTKPLELLSRAAQSAIAPRHARRSVTLKPVHVFAALLLKLIPPVTALTVSILAVEMSAKIQTAAPSAG